MRDKYETRSIPISSEMTRETAVQLIKNIPLDPIKPIEVLIREQVKQRGMDANGLMWLRIGEIADQGWVQGRKYNADVWHAFLKRNILPSEVTLKDGTKCSKWIESPDGVLDVISTTQLEKTCFSEYIMAIEAYGSQELGCHFSANPRDHGRQV